MNSSFQSQKDDSLSYSEIAKKVNLRHELVRPKVKERLYNKEASRRPSSLSMKPEFINHNLNKKNPITSLKNKKSKKRYLSKSKSRNRSPSSQTTNSFNQQRSLEAFSNRSHSIDFDDTPKKKINSPQSDQDLEKNSYTFRQSPQSPSQESSSTQQDQDSSSSRKRSSGGGSKSPIIQGEIPPLDGLISQVNHNFLIDSAYASVSCSNPKIELFDILTMTPLEDNPITFEGVDRTTRFIFYPNDLNLDLEAPARYKVKITGCSEELEKIVTSYYLPQSITAASSLLAKITNTDVNYNPTEELSENLEKMEKIISSTLGDSIIDYQAIYSELETNQDVLTAFQNITEGEDVVLLKNAAPKVKNLDIPSILDEQSPHTFEADALHWDNDYTIAFQWILDGSTVSYNKIWSYTPPSNTAATAHILLKIGKKSSSSNDVDTSLPHHEFEFTLNVNLINDPPILINTQSVALAEDTVHNFNLNDATDVDSPSLDYIITSNPTNGSLSCTPGTTQCTYVPNSNFYGTDSFTYKANDGELDSNIATVNLSVSNVNDPPLAGANLALQVDEDNSLSLTLNQATDIDHPQGSLSYKITSSPSHGTLTNCISPSGYSQDLTCDYSPHSNFNGNDSFTYIAHDGSLDADSSTIVNITVNPINDAPTLTASQSETTSEDNALNFTLNSGSDIESSPLNYSVVTGPGQGVLNCDGGTSQSCTYTPNLNYNGSDSFTYKVDDGELDSNIATVNLTVTTVNDPPTMGSDQNLSLNEDNPLNLTLNNASDVDGDSLGYKIITPPSHGVLSSCITTGSYGTDLSCTYTPNGNYNGPDSFTYIANDSSLDAQNVATVSLTIVSVNDAPTLGATQSETTNEDTPITFNLNSGTDVESDPLTYIVVAPPATGTLSCNGGSSRECTFTPSLNFNGSETFTYKVNDGELDSNIATVTLTVNSVNDAPVMASDQSLITNEDNPINFTISNATDVDGDSLTYKIVSPPTQGTLSNCITTGSYTTDLTCTYTPDLNYNGSDSFTYIANDSLTDATTFATINLTINPINDAPTLTSTQSVTTNEDNAVAFTLNSGSDIENSPLDYIIVGQPTEGTLSCTGGTSTDCTYTPDNNYNGTTTFTYKVNDGELDSNTATVTLNITSENDAPVMAGNQTESTLEDTLVSFTLSGATDVDIPAQTLQYKLITPPANGSLSNCIQTGSYNTDISCDYTPSSHFNGSDSFTYRANDTLTDSSTDSTVNINITAVNDAPTVPSTQSLSTNEDIPINFNLNSGSDIEGQSLTYTIVSSPASGNLSCTGGTSTACTYTPALNFNGTTTFTYKANDGALDSNTATVTITINSINDAPVMAADQTEVTNEDNSVNFTLSGATDVDGDSLTYKIVTAPTQGTLSNCITTTYGTDLTCTYTPNLNYNGSDSFTYIATDGSTTAATHATVNLTINAVNDAPTLATTQSISTNEDTPLNFNLNSGSDIDGDTLSYIVVASPASGSLSCTGGTSTACTYTPALNFNGTTTFTYKANDGALDSNTATVTITINSINDAPVMAADQTEVTNEDNSVNFTLSGATDVDGDSLTYKIVTAPTQGTLSNCITTTYGTDLTCTYTPNLNYNGSDSFTYIATDGSTTAATHATVNLTINAVNDAPTLATTQSISTNEDTPLNFNLNSGSDIDGDTLSYIVVASPASGSLSCTGGTSTACTYTPALNFNGTTTFTYKANDGALDSNTATVTITVNSINDAPVMGSDQSFTTDDNTTLAFSLNNASDVDGDSLTYKITSPPTKGTLSNCIVTGSYGTDLTCNYISNVNYNGIDTFTYIAYDGNLDALSSATVTITVNDKTPSSPPSISLTSDTYTASTSNTMTVSSCSDIASVLINEGSQPTAGDPDWSTCTTTANATTYTLASTAQGLHILKVWSKDPNGNISTTSNDLIVYYDTVNPTLAPTTPGIQKGGNSINLSWDATDESTSSSQSFQVDFYNGSAWSSVGTTTAANGPLSSQSFSRAWTVPSLDITNARFRVSFTDLAGNSSTVQSSAFEIDSTAPSLSYSSPADGSYHLSSTVITGNCENGLPINISGDLQADFATTCSSGSFSQTINFSDNDGSKSITINQVDPAGNSTSVTRTFIRDELAPTMAKTSGTSPDFTNQNTPNTWGGTCEGNYTIYVTGDETTSFNCSSGSWTWTASPKTSDGTYTYNLVQTDAAGNTSSPPLSLSWERDATAPSFNATAPTAIEVGQTISETKFTDSLSFSGTCEGNNVITISNAQSDTISCSSSNWSWTSQNFTTDGTRTFTFTQADSAGNTSTFSYAWTRDSNFPALSIDNANIKNNGSTATFSGSCENGLTITITGAQSTSTTCSSGSWSWTTATTASDLSNNYNFAQTNASSNTTTVSGSWIRETNLPVLTSFTTSQASPSGTNFIPYSLNANSQNANVYITDICLKADDSTAPILTDDCWIAVNSPTIGIAAAQNISISDYSFLIGWEPAIYNIYAWVKDEAGNISTNSASLNQDHNVMEYVQSEPPSIWDVTAANSDTASIPPTRADATVPTGTDVYIRWKVSNATPLGSTAINLFYTQDESTFTAIAGAQGIAPHTSHSCPNITLAANEGCFKWTGGSPLATSYKIRVKVTNQDDISTQLISNPLNSNQVKIIAGNTEAGLGGDARTALFFNKTVGDSSDIQTLVFTDSGNIYFADYKRGIITVDPTDGKQKLYIPMTGTSSGDGGPAQSATLRNPLKLTLDYQGRLLIYDYDRIRRVDLNMDNPTIETIIGGGSSTADTVANPLDVKLNRGGTWDYRTNAMMFTPLPNGDILFNSDRAESLETTEYRFRTYKAATGQVTSMYLGGTGDAWQPTQDLSKCRIGYMSVQFNMTTSAIEGITGHSYHHKNFPECDMYTSSSDYTYARVYFDPQSGQAITPPDNAHRWYQHYNFTGLDGKSYVTLARTYMNRNNFDGTYTRIIGSGTRGQCDDGTLATACAMDIYAVFVNKQGKIYFNDRGRIRTVDDDGKVVTIFGQGYSYGDGVNATNSRFAEISRVTRLNNGKIIVNDTKGQFIKEFVPDGNITLIAGNGVIASQDTTTQANAQAVRNPYWMAVDRVTGNIYSDAHTHYGRMSMLNRSTGLWETILYNTSGTAYYDPSSDGMAGNLIDTDGNQNRLLPLGYANGFLFANRMRYDNTNQRYEDFMLKKYDSTNNYTQTHILGKVGYESPNESCTELRTAPVAGSTCFYEYWDNYRSIFYDSNANRYIIAKMYRGAQRRILAINSNGTVEQIGYTSRNIDDGFTYARRAGTDYLYYCHNKRLYAHNITTDTDLGLLDWTMSNFSCRGVEFDYNPTNDSIIFPFEQNGLYGVAEYFLN